MIELYRELIADFDIVTIEDPLDEEDFEGFAELTRAAGIQIVGDDLFVTNPERLRTGIEVGAANSLLWKVNQIGTLSEALDAADLAHRSRLHASSSRSAPARPRTRSSPTSPWPSTPARSRPVPPSAASEPPSTTGCSDRGGTRRRRAVPGRRLRAGRR